ncbi:MAG: hypothetical protein IKM90_06065 [Bacteroidaceae bacterium]|nr:hypothetical protein [Bacteroidaceae bacterium]
MKKIIEELGERQSQAEIDRLLEPLHGLDRRRRTLVMEIIKAFCLNPQKTLIIVTHYPEELPSTIDHTLTLKRNSK